MQIAKRVIKTYVPSLSIKMLCNVRDVPIFFIYRLHHANSQTGYCQIYVPRYTPKCYVICEMYLFHIQITSYEQLMHAHMYMYICTSCK
jgi:hypothetical protein